MNHNMHMHMTCMIVTQMFFLCSIGGHLQPPPAPPAPIQSGGGQASKYQEMIYDDNTKYNVNPSRPGSQFPPPYMGQPVSNKW